MKNKDEHQHRAGAPFILPFIIYPQKQEWNSDFGLDKDRKKDSWQGF